jgi:transcription antitermination factor NusG
LEAVLKQNAGRFSLPLWVILDFPGAALRPERNNLLLTSGFDGTPEVKSAPTWSSRLPATRTVTNSTAAADFAVPHWYAVHTSPRHEKRVAEYLSQKDVENFLPLFKTVRKWKNGVRAEVEFPLFPGYLFTRIPLQERLRVLELPSVVRLVGFNSIPIAVSAEEIETLRSGLHCLQAEPHPYLTIGDRVRIVSGPMAGLQGILIRTKQDLRVVLSIDLIMRSIAVEVELSEVERVSKEELQTTS